MKNNAGDSSKVFTRRAFMVGVIQTSLLTVLGGRLAWLQISQGQRYRTLADQNRINVKILAPPRGQIVDRYGAPLAINNQNYRVLVIPEQTDSIENSVRALSSYIRLEPGTVEKTIKKSKQQAKFVPVEIKDNLTWDEVAKIEVNITDLPGLQTDTGEIRAYPYGQATAHLVGYVGAVSEKDAGGNPVLNLPGFKVGKDGIEKQYDEQMRGQAGTSQVEVNVLGREVRELENMPAKPGQRLMLTIDGELQRFLHDRLSLEQSASAIVMDAHTGEVYAMSSYPSYDPNHFNRGIPTVMWQEFLANPGNPLVNKTISGQYPPASTFKMITAIAGLRTGKISEHRHIYCPGHYKFGDTKFHCWKPEGHGTLDVIGALERSCDTYFYNLATEIGIDEIATTARLFGLGDKLGFELPQERPGLIPDKAWKMGRDGKSWTPGESINASIGQGYLLATPLQLAVMTARMVNGGYAVKPYITAAFDDRRTHTNKPPKMDVDPKHLAMVREGMERVVNNQQGTAFSSRIKEEQFAMAGKTGTAQVRRITKQQRDAGILNETLPWKQRHHALFVGYAPYFNPRYVTAVVVEHGVGGGRTAAPLARDLLLETQRRGIGALALEKHNTQVSGG